MSLNDGRQAWEMNADGKYTQRKTAEIGLHTQMMTLTKQRLAPKEDGEPKES
jgi:hypothetical protein